MKFLEILVFGPFFSFDWHVLLCNVYSCLSSMSESREHGCIQLTSGQAASVR